MAEVARVMTNMHTFAVAAYDAGLCVVPPRGKGSKAPLGQWKGYETERPSRDQLDIWYSDPERTGIGALMGRTSQNTEMFEFDDMATYEAFMHRGAAAGLAELCTRIASGYSERTPNGVHWIYRCETVEGNQKLAQRLKSDDERESPNDAVKALIETRGEGGYVVLAPTHGDVHPSGKPYEFMLGGYDSIVTITPDERAQLFALARTFDSMPRQEVGAPTQSAAQEPGSEAERPGDYFARTRSWSDVLTPAGWTFLFTHGDESYWCRPGKERGISASTNYAKSDLLKVFSTSTPFDTTRTYTKFGAYAVLAHNGSFGDAARRIRAEMPRVERPKLPTLPDLVAYNGPGKIGPNTIGELAPQPVESKHLARLRGRFLSTSDVMDMPEPDWLIEGVLVSNTLVTVWGAPGSYKSFLMLDWALCIASATWWKGREVVAGPVLYVAAEGAAGLGKRIKAWSEANNVRSLDRASWLAETVDLLDAEQEAALTHLVTETAPRLVVIDTLARSMPGGDENSAQDMGRAIEACDRVRRSTGATVVLVHHSTKEGSAMRGSSALKGAVDTEIEVRADGTLMTMTCRKQKDAEPFMPRSLHLVKIGNSCVLSNVSREAETTGSSSQALETIRSLFRETFLETGVSGSELRTFIEQQLPTSRASAYRLINELVTLGILVNRATPSRPFYEAGSNFYADVSSQRLTFVSDRLSGPGQSSHESPSLRDGDVRRTAETNASETPLELF